MDDIKMCLFKETEGRMEVRKDVNWYNTVGKRG
jgi:hypothetical protein